MRPKYKFSVSITINLKAKNNKDNILVNKNFYEEFSYAVQSDKFNMSQYEDNIINNLNNATPPNLSDGTNSYQGSAYALRRFARPYKIKAVKEQQLHGGGNAPENKKVGFWDSIRKRPTQSTPGEGGLISIEPPESNLEEFKGCDDNLELNKGKRKFKFSAAVASELL